MDRRSFIRKTLAGTLAASSLGAVPLIDLLALPAVAAAAPPLAVRKGKDIPLLVRDVLTALGGMSAFVRSGETVVIKPNIGWDRTVELAANTHPEVVRALAELCLEAGARRVLVFDRTCNDARRCYVQSGLQAAIDSLGSDRVKLEYIDRRAFQPVAIRGGRVFDRWEFYRPALEANRYINVPVAKHHSISKLTLAMKNTMGAIGGNRGRLHHRIDESLADINSVIHSTLTVVDATRILVANGPQGGRREDVRTTNTLIASPDIVAADAYAATLFGYRPDEIPTVVAGARRGLGTMDLSGVQMV